MVSVTAVGGPDVTRIVNSKSTNATVFVETTFEPESLSVLDVVRHVTACSPSVAESIVNPESVAAPTPSVFPVSVPEMVSVAHEHANSRSTVYALVDASKRSAAPTALPPMSAAYTVKSPSGVDAPANRTSVSIVNFHACPTLPGVSSTS